MLARANVATRRSTTRIDFLIDNHSQLAEVVFSVNETYSQTRHSVVKAASNFAFLRNCATVVAARGVANELYFDANASARRAVASGVDLDVRDPDPCDAKGRYPAAGCQVPGRPAAAA